MRLRQLIHKPWIRNYPVDKYLDTVLREAIKRTVSVEQNRLMRTLSLNSGTQVTFWDANYPYAYANEGKVTKAGKVIYSWHDTMPFGDTVYDLRRTSGSANEALKAGIIGTTEKQ